jgi:hypothetical protein
MLDSHGSIEAFFADGMDPEAETVEAALDAFSTRACALDQRAVYGRVVRKPGVSYFFARPSSGGACKRLNLFLRWMVRRDGVDLGVWTRVRPSQLIVPLDTHVIRLGRCLGLTRYASPGWKMAADITASLRQIDPVDPVRYDFSLCHIGMMNACGYGRPQGDRQCPLRGLCAPGRGQGREKEREDKRKGKKNKKKKKKKTKKSSGLWLGLSPPPGEGRIAGWVSASHSPSFSPFLRPRQSDRTGRSGAGPIATARSTPRRSPRPGRPR